MARFSTSRSRLRTPLVLGFAMVLGLTSACGSGSSSKSDGDTFKVGYVSDFTGPLASMGQPMIDGFTSYIEHVNKAGGVDGKKIEIIRGDEKGDINQARIAVNTLQSKGALAMFGGLSSNIWGALSPMGAELKMAQITNGLTDDRVIPPTPYAYSSFLGASTMADLALNFVEDKLGSGKHRIATVIWASATSEKFMAYIEKSVKERGWTLVGSEAVEADATQATTQGRKIAADKPDATILYTLDATSPIVVSGLRQQGVKGPIINYVGGSGEATFKAINDPEYYGLRSYVTPEDTSVPGVADMVAQAKEAGITNAPTSTFFTAGYMQAMLAVEALKNCDSPCTGETFNKALESVDDLSTNGLTGNITLSSERHRALAGGRMYSWDAAKGRTVPANEWTDSEVGITD